MHNRFLHLRLLMLTIAMLALLLPLASAQGPQVLAHVQASASSPIDSPPITVDDRQVVIVHYSDRRALERAAAKLDIWEVHPDERYFVALVRPAEYTWLLLSGYTVSVDAARTAQLNAPPGYPCYRTILDLYSDLQTRAANYPGLTELKNIGSSYESRTLWVIKVTNKAITSSKPRFFLMANIHGREMITPETAMVYLDYLLQNYGRDPDVTWLLDWHEVHILVSANPDGHVKNELTVAYWRKNTHPYGTCSADQYGVDLNRNFAFKWGCCGGSSGDTCDETYRGPSAASEPETVAVQNYVYSLFPDQRGPGDTDPAPSDATGVLITLHSYSNLVLWPWGWTSTAAPNSAGLSALGRKLATYNGYTPEQSDTLYPTDGSTDDWSYGELGIASYTFEMGSSGDGFFPSCSRYDALIQPNVPALIYAAKVARTPYLTSLGPDALNVTATPTTTAGTPLVLTAAINDTNNGNKAIAAAEYYVDTPPWSGGTPISMTAADGAFNQPIENVMADISPIGLSMGRHIALVRGKDADGNWGPYSAVFFWVQASSTIAGHVTVAGNSSPIPGAAVDWIDGSSTYHATTDASGDYVIQIPNGIYTGTASMFGYFSETVTGVIATTGLTTTQNFSLTAMLTGTLSGVVRELATNLPLTATIVVQGTPLTLTTYGATGAFSGTLPAGLYVLTVSAAGHVDRTLTNVSITGGQTTSIEIMLATVPCVLLVDDDYYRADRPFNYEDYYIPALRATGIAYDIWETRVQGDPSSNDLGRYRAALWFTGDAPYATLNAANQNALSTILSDGGALFLSGQDIASDIHSQPGDFLGNTLRTSFVTDSSGQTRLNGSGLYAGQTITIAGGDGANNQTSPDVVAPLSGATSVFTYPDSSAGGLIIQGDSYRAVFLSFGVESLSTASDRQSVLRTGLNWLGCATSPVDLQIILDGPPGPIARGDLLTYTLGVTNSSAIPISGLTVTDTLPAGLDFVSATPAAVFDGQQVRWSGLALNAEDTTQLSFVARVKLAWNNAFIRNANYGGQALQMPQSVNGTHFVDTLIVSWHNVFLPIVIRDSP